MKYDLAVVGGGPSGSMAAIQLIGTGLRVVILDRARFPRMKPCGGGISYRAYQRFGAVAPVFRSVPTNYVSRVVFESPSGNVVDFDSPEVLYAMIRRIEFDNALLNHCKQGGIEVREDVTVSQVVRGEGGVRLTTTAGEEFLADMVIGADGVNSTVAVHTGMRGSWKPSQMAIDGTEESSMTDVKVRQDTMYVYYGIGGGAGYGYIFPKACDVNFGVGYLLDYCQKHIVEKPYERHLRFLDQMKEAGAIAGESVKANFHSYVLPIGGPLERISSERVLLVGDAAGFVNGFTAEGIYYAMVSGEHAGRAALAAVQAKNFSAEFLRGYDRACEAEVGAELRTSVMLQKHLLPHPARIDSIVRFAARSKSMRMLLAKFAVGTLTYEEMKRRALVEALPTYLRYKVGKVWQRLAHG